MIQGLPAGISPQEWMKFQLEMKKLEMKKLEFDKEIRIKELEVQCSQGQANVVNAHYQHHNVGRIPKLKEDEDIDVYLRAFENLARSNNWPREIWAAKLATELVGKAKIAYARLNDKDAQNYETLKKAILDKYEISAESYRMKFRGRVRKQGECIKEWVADLDHQINQWIQFAGIKEDDPKGIIELCIMEQAMNNMPEDLKVYLRYRNLQ